MLLALLVAVLSVLLGAALSFVPSSSRGLLGYMRTFATLAAVAVVFTHLLPEALHELGSLSILLFFVGWFTPALAHFIGQRSTSGRPAHAVLEAGYWGLVVHHVADGIGLGTYTRLPADQGSHLDVIVALAAHTVPLIAVVALAYRTTFGTRSAVLRSLGLALASVLGIALSSLVAAKTIESFAPVIAAVAAGLLLHVVTHDLTEDAPRTPFARLLDLLVAALGVAVSLLGVWHSTDAGTRELARQLVQLTERTSLVILVALATAACSLRLPDRSSKFARAALPAAALGAESVLLSVALFGFVAAGLRLLVTGAAVALLPAKHEEHAHGESAPPNALARPRQRNARELRSLARARSIAGRPAALGARGGARSSGLSGLLGLGLLVLIANLDAGGRARRPCSIAIGLRALGFSPGAVLLFATLAPIAAFLGNAVKPRLIASAVCLAIAVASDALGLSVSALDGSFSEGDLGPRAATALALLLLFGVWQRGARIWLSAIVPPPPHEHEHAHDVHGPHAH